MEFETLRVVDLKTVKERFSDDLELLQDLIDLFMNDLQMYLDNIQNAINTKDGNLLRQNSHALKGAIVNFEAPRAKRIAQQLEEKGKNNDFQNTLELKNRLEVEILQFVKEIKKFLNKN